MSATVKNQVFNELQVFAFYSLHGVSVQRFMYLFFKMNKTCVYTHTAQIYLQIMFDLCSFTWCAATHVTWTMRKLNVKAVHVFLCKSVS